MKAAKNDITGASLVSKPVTDKYADGWERIFGKKHETVPNDKRTSEQSVKRTEDQIS